MTKFDNERLVALKNEITMAEKVNEEELQPIISENIERYTGIHVPFIGRDWDIVLNEIYPIVQYWLPSTFFKNPRAFLKPRTKTYIGKKRDPVSGKMTEMEIDSGKSARTQEHQLNYSISQMGYKKQVRKVLLDALLTPFSVLWHGYKGEFGMTEEQSIEIKEEKIFVTRISPLRFIYDPAVMLSGIDEAKWVGRIIDIPLNDLLEDDKLDVDKNLKGRLGYGSKIGLKSAKDAFEKGLIKVEGLDYVHLAGRLRKPLIDFADKDFSNSRYSRFVRLYEIYHRPGKKEKREGSNGWILLLTDEQKKPLRVHDWVIKAEGWPAKILQFNELNDSLFGINDIATYKSIADHKNSIINLQLRNAQENTKTWVGISKEGISGEEGIEKYQRGENTIVLFDSGNPRDRMFVASPGGAASSELYLIDQRIQRNLEDKSGVTDLKRGFLQSGEESAASVKLRAMGGGARPAYRQDIMADFLKESLLYLNQLNKQFMTYKDVVRVMGTLDIEWSENLSKEELQADVDVEIDVISMLPEDPEKELRELNTILMLMIQAITTPDVKMKLEQEGKTMNLSPIIEQILLRMRITNPDVFRNIQPKESQGFVSVQQLREAKQNTDAALTGVQIPFPPKMEDDHVAKLEVYTAINDLLTKAGQISDVLNQLIMMHQALLQEIESKEARPGRVVGLKQPKMDVIGA